MSLPIRLAVASSSTPWTSLTSISAVALEAAPSAPELLLALAVAVTPLTSTGVTVLGSAPTITLPFASSTCCRPTSPDR